MNGEKLGKDHRQDPISATQEKTGQNMSNITDQIMTNGTDTCLVSEACFPSSGTEETSNESPIESST